MRSVRMQVLQDFMGDGVNRHWKLRAPIFKASGDLRLASYDNASTFKAVWPIHTAALHTGYGGQRHSNRHSIASRPGSRSTLRVANARSYRYRYSVATSNIRHPRDWDTEVLMDALSPNYSLQASPRHRFACRGSLARKASLGAPELKR